MKMVSRNVGRCLTEWKRDDYDQIVGTFTEGYVTTSQFRVLQPKHLTDMNFGSYDENRIKTPKCPTGGYLFGINPDGSLTELMSIIDSSD